MKASSDDAEYFTLVRYISLNLKNVSKLRIDLTTDFTLRIMCTHCINSRLTYSRQYVDENGMHSIRLDADDIKYYDGYNTYYITTYPLVYRNTSSIWKNPVHTPQYDQSLLIHEYTEVSRYDIKESQE